MKVDKYALYVNGVLYEKFSIIKEIDNFLFENNLDNNDNVFLQVVRIK